MTFFKSILGFRDFTKIDDIKKYINLNLFYDKKEDIFNAQHLLVFDTTKQKTWLIVSNLRLFCVLDDIAKDTFIVRWNLNKSEIIHNGSIILHIEVHDYSKNSGLINFGENHKGWLYSKKLFPTADSISKAIHNVIRTAMQ